MSSEIVGIFLKMLMTVSQGFSFFIIYPLSFVILNTLCNDSLLAVTYSSILIIFRVRTSQNDASGQLEIM